MTILGKIIRGLVIGVIVLALQSCTKGEEDAIPIHCINEV